MFISDYALQALYGQLVARHRLLVVRTGIRYLLCGYLRHRQVLLSNLQVDLSPGIRRIQRGEGYLKLGNFNLMLRLGNVLDQGCLGDCQVDLSLLELIKRIRRLLLCQQVAFL